MPVNRTPTTSSGQSSCVECSAIDTQKMVQCDNCGSLTHQTCAGISDDAVRDEAFTCINCVATGASSTARPRADVAPKGASIEEPNSPTPYDAEQNEIRRNSILHHREMKQMRTEFQSLLERYKAELEETKAQNRFLSSQIKELQDSQASQGSNYQSATVNVHDLSKQLGNLTLTPTTVSDTRSDLAIATSSNNTMTQESPATTIASGVSRSENSHPQQTTSWSSAGTAQTPLTTTSSTPYVPRAPLYTSNHDHTLHQNATNSQPIPSGTIDTSVNANVSGAPRLTADQRAARKSLKTDLPRFDGSPDLWPNFISFYEYTNLYCAFDDRENLIRLQNSLTGRARQFVQGLLIIPQNVPYIITRLRALFGRPEQIIEQQLAIVRKLPDPTLRKISTVLDFGAAVHNLVTTIISTQLPGYLNNPIILKELVRRLPDQQRISWGEFIRNQVSPDLAHFDTWLDGFTMDASAVYELQPTPSRGETRHINAHYEIHDENPENATTSPEPSPTSERASSRVRECPVCQKSCTSVSTCQTFHGFSRHERWDKVRAIDLCRTCLRNHRGRCRLNSRCGVKGCTRRHHPLLHQDVANPSVTSPEIQTQPVEIHTEQHMAHQVWSEHTLFRIVPVRLRHGNEVLDTYAFLDDGSSVSLIDQTVANQLKVEGPVKTLCLQWTNEHKRTESDSKMVTIEISGQDPNSRFYQLKDARTVMNLSLPSQNLDISQMYDQYPHLRGLPIKSYKNVQPMVLIGLDNQFLTTPLRNKEGCLDDPVATKTRLGWTVHGKVKAGQANVEGLCVHVCPCGEPAEALRLMKENYDIENIGVKSNPRALQTKEERRAEDIMSSTTRRVGERYETGLLWAFDDFVFPNNKQMALKRLECLQRKLSADPELAANVNSQIDEMLNDGYIRRMSDEESSNHTERTWYLPVFPVLNPNKPGKVRLVWDAAAKCRGVALNSFLMKGPDAVPPLPQPLMRFRERRFAITGDIRHMFHQIRVRKEDQDCQRFLWPGTDSRTPTTYVMQVLTFGAACSPSLAQYVKNVNAERYARSMPRAVTSIKENHYVDDMLDSCDTENEVIELAEAVREIHSNGGFYIRNWKSNSRAVCAKLETQAPAQMNLDFDSSSEKVLGMWWRPAQDCFTYSLQYNRTNKDLLKGLQRPKKREVLSLLMSIFDPNGHLSHYTIHLKLLLQDSWRTGHDWHDELNDEQWITWQRWIGRLPEIETVRIPRCFLTNIPSYSGTETQLHLFVDAGAEAYAAVAYLRVQNGTVIDVAQVGAKAKVAPVKPVSIPRLELQAALLGARYADFIKKCLSIEINRCHFWSDSTTVLSWLRTNVRRYKPFVAYRVAEIQDLSDVMDWHWISTKNNIADEATKSTNTPDLHSDSRWFQGPSFLYQPQAEWPLENIEDLAVTEEEVRVQFHAISESLIDFQRFSSYSRLLRTAAYVHRFRSRLLHRENNRLKPLQAEELKQAEYILIRIAQTQSFGPELARLRNNEPLAKTSKLYTLSPYIDDNGILRLESRITYAKLPPDTINPVILSHENRFTALLIQSIHERQYHLHHETVLNQLNQRFHVTKARVTVKKVINKCQHCRVRKAKVQTPRMAPLPLARVSSHTPPFTYTGVDYFGPLFVAVRRSREKRWGVLFTCLTTRAIHLEVAHSLDTNSCILAIKRFIGRRGPPKEIFSDRGTNFIGTERTLREELRKINHERVMEAVVTPQITWKFNPPLAPHMGGCWERMVRTVKTAMYAALPERAPSDEVLLSALVDIENVVNSRPLTHVPLDGPEADAITPNHIILGYKGNSGNLSKLDDSPEIIKKSFRVAEQISNKFWKRWLKEYLPDLTRRTKWHEEVKNPEVGQIAYIIDPNAPKGSWAKGKIVEVTKGSDGRIRQVKLYTENGICVRPTTKIAILPVESHLRDEGEC